ncbi:hypothetical protein X801_05697, partial [Opisthorchis viverrini]
RQEDGYHRSPTQSEKLYHKSSHSQLTGCSLEGKYMTWRREVKAAALHTLLTRFHMIQKAYPVPQLARDTENLMQDLRRTDTSINMSHGRSNSEWALGIQQRMVGPQLVHIKDVTGSGRAESPDPFSSVSTPYKPTGMSTNALITNTALSSGTTSPHLSQSTDPVQTGSKRRWSSEKQSAPGISCSNDQSPLSEKRPRLLMRSGDGTIQTAYTFWLALDVITAGRQGVELGRDQAPVVQISAVLGKFSGAETVDRFTVNIRPESFVRPQNSSTETNPLPGEHVGPNLSEEYTHWLQTATNLSNGFYENVLHNPQTPDPTHEPGATADMVPISLDAMKAAHWEDASQLPSYNSPSLPEAMNMGHSVPVGEDPEQSALIVVTEGHVQLRNVLQPQAAYLGIDRALMHRTPWCLYVSILDWCRQAFGDQTGTDASSCNKRITNLMEAVTGVPICEPQIIRSVYEHKVFPKTISLEDSCVVEVRQVPWSATPSIIAGFFTGLNLIPGGVAIRLTDGRRSNTAIVAFTSSLNAQLALARHQHQFCGALFPETPQDTQQSVDRAGTKDKQAQTPTKPSTLQVYSASAREFIQCAG